MKSAYDIGREMLAAKTAPMSKEETECMLRIMLAPAGSLDGVLTDPDAPFAFKVIATRCKWAGVQVDAKAIMMLSLICKSPGDCVLYCAALHTIFTDEKRQVTLSDLCQKFPWGFPTDDEMHRIWDAQKYRPLEGKTGPDNCVDYREAWKVPQPADG